MISIRYEKPSILNDISSEGHVVIEASAGTGKTYTLEHLVVDLLLDKDKECAIEEILVVTFTRRATAELRRRVREILTKILAQYEAQDASKSCAADIPHWVIDPDGAKRLRQAVLGFDRAEIFTIHSFCQKLLTENAFQNHQLFDLELVDEKALFAECYEDILRTKISTVQELKGWFNAWMHPKVSGKIESLASDLQKVYSSNGILARSEKYPNAFQRAEALLRDVEANTVKSHLAWKQPGWKTDILGHLLKPVADEMSRRKQSEGLYTYNDMLELVGQSISPKADNPTSNKSFLDALRQQYRYALIDEFQDTDPVQWEIFRTIFVDGTSSHRLFLIGDPKQAIYKFRGADVWTYLRAVDEICPPSGDPNSDSKRVVLGYNYRSTPEMVAAYNAIFEHMNASPEQSFFTNPKITYENPVKPNPMADRAIRDMNDAPITSPAITALRINEGDKKETIAPRWLDWMLAEIESILWGAGQFKVPDKKEASGSRPVNASDIFVLTNSNAESREMGRLLHKRGIPYSFYRQGGLYESGEALDILALLQAIAQPKLRAARRAAYRTPFFAIPIRELADFDDSDAGERAQALLYEWREIAQKHAFTRLFRKIADDSGILLREILLGRGERALTNYQHILETLGEEASKGYKSLDDLIGWLARKIEGSDGEDDQDLQRLETDRPAVQVMTMHKSKGLEAEVVFIYGGFSSRNSGITTFINSDDPSAAEAERVTLTSVSKDYLGGNDSPQKTRVNQQAQWDSERVMYVAITRAKSRLYLCHAGPEAKYGRGGRHEALVRSLDRIHQNKSVPKGLIKFIEFNEGYVHPDSRSSQKVDESVWNEVQTARVAIDQDLPDWAKLRKKGRQLTAFSSVKKHDAPSADKTHEDEPDPPAAPAPDPRFGADTPMPWGGTDYGSFLHNVLEDLSDYSSALRCSDVDAWLALDEVKCVFEQRSKADRIGPEFTPYSARILFDTLRTPLALPGFDKPVAIADIPMTKIAKEIDFHFPMPQTNLDFARWPDDAPTIERGWIKGSIDLTFEHDAGGDSRVFIADWKSNFLKDYRPEAVARSLDDAYALQARIYTLAIVRMLGITNAQDYGARFGGCLYLMLRAMSPAQAPGYGVAICRPTWAQLCAWDKGLVEDPDTWNRPLPVFS